MKRGPLQDLSYYSRPASRKEKNPRDCGSDFGSPTMTWSSISNSRILDDWMDSSKKDALPFRAYFIQQCRLSGYLPRIGKTASSLDALFGHVASGYGISATPDHIRPRPGLALCCVRTDCPPLEFGAVWRSENKSPLLQHFVKILRQQLVPERPPNRK